MHTVKKEDDNYAKRKFNSLEFVFWHLTGGLDIAAEWAGFCTVGQCEFADYPTKILEKHWPDVPRWRDVRELTAESFRERTGSSDVTVLSGGDPCQPHSTAGKRLGELDYRYLWPEMFRIITELLPDWVVNENVRGSISNGIMDKKISMLEAHNYSCGAFLIPACAVGAKHQRYRVFTVAHLDGKRVEGCTEKSILRKSYIQGGQISQPFQEAERRFDTFESRLCRSLYGIPNGVDRLKCLGNAVVPQQAYPIFRAIAGIEMEEST
jgi:DNA (cytosine-5)-methyltransferase 1